MTWLCWRERPIKCALDPLTPRNEGSYRSVTVDAPEGSILNPRFPAPCSARQLTGHLLAGVIYRALAQAIPDKVIAESGSAPTLRSVYSGVDRRGQSFSQVLFASGGMGGSAVQDGHDCTAFPTNTGSASIEAFESISPLIVWKKALRADSGGAGKFRSPHQKSRSVLQPGDRLTLRFSGGGGFGDPRERDPQSVRADLRDGIISAEQAHEVYGLPRETAGA
jgi:N-methylhydantoinase B